jgi:hypothetical protein
MTNPLYKIQYLPDGEACPYYLSEKQDPDEWEWGSYEPDALSVNITKKYTTTITDNEVKQIDFDFYGTDSPYVSNPFVKLCEEFSVKFRLIPIDLTLSDGSRPTKSYFVFLSVDHLALLNIEKSESETDVDRETGKTAMSALFPNVPIYNKISKFVAKDLETPHLFNCIEIFSLVCSDTFRNKSREHGLKGLDFIPLDENFVYDPWADW